MIHNCQNEGCDEIAIRCELPDHDDDFHEPDWLCPNHAAEEGFCCICGHFSAGITGFDFHHPGFCDNCNDEIEDFDDFDEDDEFYSFD